jgi:eukaryotic-like serine/threonine-protein kinase
MPGGESVLFTIVSPNGRAEDSQIAILNLQTGTSHVVLRGANHAHYVSTGHLVYGAEGTLYAVPFSLKRLAVTATAAPVMRGVLTGGFRSQANVALAANGSLVYVTGGARGGAQQTVTRVDRQGRGSPLVGLATDGYRDVRLSPDGTQLALATQDDVFVYNFNRSTRIRLTTDPSVDRSPVWTPNGTRIVFTSRRSGFPELFSRLADGSGIEERLLAGSSDLIDLRANEWTADGKQLLYTEVPASRGGEIKQAAMADLAHAISLVNTDSASPVSPRGGWMAYQSRVSGSTEIYVERYPDLGDRKLISVGGGRLPVWSADGRELFFTNGRQMLAVPIEYGATLSAGRPEVLFEASISILEGNRPYDVTGDGRFLMIVGSETDGSDPPPQIVVVQNWTEELKRLVPAH